MQLSLYHHCRYLDAQWHTLQILIQAHIFPSICLLICFQGVTFNAHLLSRFKCQWTDIHKNSLNIKMTRECVFEGFRAGLHLCGLQEAFTLRAGSLHHLLKTSLITRIMVVTHFSHTFMSCPYLWVWRHS